MIAIQVNHIGLPQQRVHLLHLVVNGTESLFLAGAAFLTRRNLLLGRIDQFYTRTKIFGLI